MQKQVSDNKSCANPQHLHRIHAYVQTGSERCSWPGRTCGLHVVTSLSYWFRNCSQGSAMLRGKRRKVNEGPAQTQSTVMSRAQLSEAHKPLIPRSEGGDNEANAPARPHRKAGQDCSRT